MLRSGRLFGCREMPFVQLRQLLVKSFIFPVEKRKAGAKVTGRFCRRIFIGNTEKTSCKLTTKGV